MVSGDWGLGAARRRGLGNRQVEGQIDAEGRWRRAARSGQGKRGVERGEGFGVGSSEMWEVTGGPTCQPGRPRLAERPIFRL